MWKRLIAATAALIMIITMTGCAAAPPPETEVVVSAAASLTDALREAEAAFEAEQKGMRLRLNLGSSGALQQQIAQGAPVDLFISAAAIPMDGLVERGLVDRSAVQSLATNKVVLIRPKSGPATVTGWEELPRARRVALGNPSHVPAGQYGKAVLEQLGLWGQVEGQLVLAEDVRQVLQYVASGEVDAGLLYQTDAASSQEVVVVAEAPAGSHEPVLYPMAVLKGARQGAGARLFADYLLSPRGREILAKHGFSLP